jgi:translation initiation factor 2B subunit (eIF-2B alpha/beta/delta family)
LNLDALVAPLRADVVSGAAVVARAAADAVRRAAVRAPAETPAELRKILAMLLVRVLDAQPAMAPLVSLGTRVLHVADRQDTLEDVRRAVAGEAEAFREALEKGTEAVGRHASRELPDEGTVLTISSSSTVRATLVHHARAGELEVICLESRPVNEGRTLAEALARRGIRTVYAVDAAANRLLERVDLVLMGADSVGDRGVVNKIGSAAIAAAAAERDIPVVVTADRTKLLPPGFPQEVDDARPGEEVWRAPAGVRVWNRYFEIVPTAHVTRIVTEDGALAPDDVDRYRKQLATPPELRAWADDRRARFADSVEEPPPRSGV